MDANVMTGLRSMMRTIVSSCSEFDVTNMYARAFPASLLPLPTLHNRRFPLPMLC